MSNRLNTKHIILHSLMECVISVDDSDGNDLPFKSNYRTYSHNEICVVIFVLHRVTQMGWFLNPLTVKTMTKKVK